MQTASFRCSSKPTRVAWRISTTSSASSIRRAARSRWACGCPNPAVRADRFRALVAVGINAFREWHVKALPFSRASFDLGAVLTRVAVTGHGGAGRARGPRIVGGASSAARVRRRARPRNSAASRRIRSTRRFWPKRSARSILGSAATVSISWRSARACLAPTIARTSSFALRGLTHYRMLMMTLERIGIRSPKVCRRRAASRRPPRGVRRPSRLRSPGAVPGRAGARRPHGARAHARRRSRAGARRASRRRAGRGRGPYSGGIALWIRRDLAAAIHASGDVESAVIAAMSGPASGEPASTPPVVVWEGQRYRLDLGAAERRRLRVVREKQGGPRLDLVLDVSAVGRKLTAEKVALDDLPALTSELSRLALEAPPAFASGRSRQRAGRRAAVRRRAGLTAENDRRPGEGRERQGPQARLAIRRGAGRDRRRFAGAKRCCPSPTRRMSAIPTARSCWPPTCPAATISVSASGTRNSGGARRGPFQDRTCRPACRGT